MQLSRVLSGSLQTNATPGSTWNLAKSRPEAFVVGVDKSFARLTRNAAFRGRDTNEGWGSEMERGQGAFGAGTLESTEESEPPPARDNMILVRANCIDFWRLIWESGLDVGKQLQRIVCACLCVARRAGNIDGTHSYMHAHMRSRNRARVAHPLVPKPVPEAKATHAAMAWIAVVSHSSLHGCPDRSSRGKRTPTDTLTCRGACSHLAFVRVCAHVYAHEHCRVCVNRLYFLFASNRAGARTWKKWQSLLMKSAVTVQCLRCVLFCLALCPFLPLTRCM